MTATADLSADLSAPPHRLPELDRFVGEEGCFAPPPAEAARLRLGFVRDAVAWHLDDRSPYAAYAVRRGFDLGVLDRPEGLADVPLLPSALFKRAGVDLVHPAAADVLWTTSSGTRGSISRIPRDDTTLRRFFASIGNLTSEMADVQTPDVRVFNLGPQTDEARHLWIAYVMAGVGVLLPRSREYVRDGVLLLEEAVRDLAAVDGERVAVIGPPPYLLELAHALSARGIRPRLRPDSLLMTIGGWKRRSGERIPRALFDDTLAAATGLPLAQVRDTFNMVELNSALIECPHKRLHLPPWVLARARDPETLTVLPSGRSGVLAYLDATAASYPGFVLSDDLGRVEEDVRCPCGRASDVLVLERRLNTMESRGCALKLDGAPTR